MTSYTPTLSISYPSMAANDRMRPNPQAWALLSRLIERQPEFYVGAEYGNGKEIAVRVTREADGWRVDRGDGSAHYRNIKSAVNAAVDEVVQWLMYADRTGMAALAIVQIANKLNKYTAYTMVGWMVPGAVGGGQ